MIKQESPDFPQYDRGKEILDDLLDDLNEAYEDLKNKVTDFLRETGDVRSVSLASYNDDPGYEDYDDGYDDPGYEDYDDYIDGWA